MIPITRGRGIRSLAGMMAHCSAPGAGWMAKRNAATTAISVRLENSGLRQHQSTNHGPPMPPIWADFYNQSDGKIPTIGLETLFYN